MRVSRGLRQLARVARLAAYQVRQLRPRGLRPLPGVRLEREWTTARRGPTKPTSAVSLPPALRSCHRAHSSRLVPHSAWSFRDMRCATIRPLHTDSVNQGRYRLFSGGVDFVGRSRELATLRDWVLQDRCRLTAVLGMGGIGKTALA